jgi:hypothetical protein
MENKIPYNRFRGEAYDKDGDIFGEMQAVSIEHLQGLSRNELDYIPMAWLYDWAKVNGLAGCIDVQDWLVSLKERREKPRALQIPQKQNTLVYIGYIDGRNKFFLKYKTGKKVCELYKGFCFVEGKRFTLTEKQMWQFRKTYYKFKRDLEKAKNNQDGFHYAKNDRLVVYFRRLQNFEYQFISQFANGDIRHDKMIIANSRVEFNFLGLERNNKKLWWSNLDEPQIDENFILFHTEDEYLNKEIKYICNKATKEDMDYLSSVDGFRRLYVDKEKYDINDISVTKIERVPLTYFNRTPRYTLYFTLENKEYYSCDYYQGSDCIFVRCHAKSVEIQITKELKEVINKMVIDLPYDEQYDDVEHREEFFFATIRNNNDNSSTLKYVLKKFGLNYQEICSTNHCDIGHSYVVWDTAYRFESFQQIMLKLNDMFKQRSICLGRYAKRKYHISLLCTDSIEDVRYFEGSNYESANAVDALRDFYATLVPNWASESITLGELQRSSGLASSETVNGGYVRAALFNLIMKCDTIQQLEEGLKARFK